MMLFLLVSCKYKDLYYEQDDWAEVTVGFDWQHTPDMKPEGMTVLFYREGTTTPERYDYAGREGGKGYQASKFGFGGGLEYGYSMAVGRRLNLDFSLGIGYQGGEYKEYEPQGDRYAWQATRQRHWFGPTKAEVSLVWLLGGSGRSKKGGDK